ncbi:tRNA (adenosine(37)-N6)-threonylcarbamoyltransferase complex ATPase subunit type 1 TsaE [Salirhabdus salicampi]|uniref:tRNA (adenosine(37)-N6)-threonylcarbamoyltransferase complex ATPase subunit type 1 TsaE n=1 Tax=Salirhabdus salicampi TaxID=476102 RepID=UPI0020C4D886|nr:tRNA (adenosine(37)-N6)-threonylcarbamoyltransferase complex ATPase subunit type 1 TsaE [Salirhabdus salicampi]MCP8617821.1 tRNA (adenosine(37)-N6)-threonylcarbamoyltransferase complex ATPase subunit type 1 TsaE [Salirhabdus salicampi]
MESTCSMKTNNPDETIQFAQKLGRLLKEGDVITLEGNIGAGKTTFTKGLAKALNIKRTVNSPTFTIVKEYEGSLPLYHMDAYRLEDGVEDIGFDEYFHSDGITVVEWPQNVSEFLPRDYLKVMIEYDGEAQRKITLEPVGSRFQTICKELTK